MLLGPILTVLLEVLLLQLILCLPIHHRVRLSKSWVTNHIQLQSFIRILVLGVFNNLLKLLVRIHHLNLLLMILIISPHIQIH